MLSYESFGSRSGIFIRPLATGMVKGRTETTMAYDASGRLTGLVTPGPGATSVTTEFAYDAQHRVVSVSLDSFSADWGPAPAVVTEFEYGRAETTVIDPNSGESSFSLDSQGRVTSTTDQLGRTRTQEWTANSNIAQTTDALSSGSALNTTTFTYGSSNNLAGASLPTGAATTAIYAMGVDCPTGTTGDAYQVKCATDANGDSRSFEYDAAGNEVTVRDTSEPSSTLMHSYVYENSTRSVCGGFAGQRCSATDGRGRTTSYKYDVRGNLSKVTPPAPLGSTTYTYDVVNRLKTVTDGLVDTTTYSYDIRDRIVRVEYEGVAA